MSESQKLQKNSTSYSRIYDSSFSAKETDFLEDNFENLGYTLRPLITNVISAPSSLHYHDNLICAYTSSLHNVKTYFW